jgi:hypothetical protein
VIKTYRNNTRWCIGDFYKGYLPLRVWSFYVDKDGLYCSEAVEGYIITAVIFNEESFFYSNIRGEAYPQQFIKERPL